MLVRQLPRAARTRLALGDTDGLWGLTEHLLALNYDAAQVANWQRANEGRKLYEQTKPPEPFERPGVKRRRRRQITTAELLAHRERTQAHAPRAVTAA
ncbi:hypothetical protein [Streptomyces cinereoruber]|uniref:hypothetical protein n=1 Tax=Streptomyces cinereoruber TaxID=67260 RepID=UPI003C2ADAC7